MMAKITNYVDAHLNERITLKIIATHCGVSVSTVTQMFHKQANSTFHDFVTSRRMVVADKLIREGIPLEQVGKLVGYQDHSTFYRAFRQHFGVSPREYRCQLTDTTE
jgi:AraC-like DNA-binding protein